MDAIRHAFHSLQSAISSTPAAEAPHQQTVAATRGDGFEKSEQPLPSSADITAARHSGTTATPRPESHKPSEPKPGSLDETNPQVGKAEAAPRFTAGTTKSPIFLGTEAEYFAEARSIIDNAKPGDIICAQMYEFENAATNGDKDAATKAPGYADQQAILPGLAAAAKRGVKVNVILDASKNKETKDIANQVIVDYLKKNAGSTGNLNVDYYPPETVNIDHAKQLIHLTPAGSNTYAVQEALAGGSNWGNHTPANDDGGGAFFGRDAVGAAQVFFRDQAFCRGDRTAPANPVDNATGPVVWKTTSPSQEGGGSAGIRDAKIAMTNAADAVYLNEFCLTHDGLLQATEAKGKNAHARLDPNELNVNRKALDALRTAGAQADWANTEMDPSMAGQKNHEKLDVYVKDGVATGLTIGSANDTANGLESTHTTTNPKTGGNQTHRTNHEIDAVVTRVTDGDYSTAPFLDAALKKTETDLASKSLANPPHHLSGTAPGQF